MSFNRKEIERQRARIRQHRWDNMTRRQKIAYRLRPVWRIPLMVGGFLLGGSAIILFWACVSVLPWVILALVLHWLGAF